MPRRAALAIVLLALVSACTGGGGAPTSQLVVAIEGPDGISVLQEQNEFPITRGVAGGYLLRVWFGGDIREPCPLEESPSSCRMQFTVELEDATEMSVP